MKIKLTSKKVKIFNKIVNFCDPDYFGDCCSCPIAIAKEEFPNETNTSDNRRCGFNCDRLLDYFNIRWFLPDHIHEYGSGNGVSCGDFSRWFCDLKIVSRYNTKI
jgi:hypothetical protein